MNFKTKALFAVLLLASLSVGAKEKAQRGSLIIKEDNIVAIQGKTMVTTNETEFYNCEGKQVKSLANRTRVKYQIKTPSEGPIPVLTSVKQVCN